jgi:hypothetical protein
MPELGEDEEEWEVEAVKDQMRKGGQQYYLVKWKGWPTEYDQWVHEKDMQNAKEMISDYLRRSTTTIRSSSTEAPKRRGRPRNGPRSNSGKPAP